MNRTRTPELRNWWCCCQTGFNAIVSGTDCTKVYNATTTRILDNSLHSLIEIVITIGILLRQSSILVITVLWKKKMSLPILCCIKKKKTLRFDLRVVMGLFYCSWKMVTLSKSSFFKHTNIILPISCQSDSNSKSRCDLMQLLKNVPATDDLNFIRAFHVIYCFTGSSRQNTSTLNSQSM